MTHDEARRMMAEAAEGRLGQDDERELALHLVGCPDCKAIFDGLQRAEPAFSSISIPEVPSWVVDAAVTRATTVLRGDADPGPLAEPHGPDAPVLTEEAVATTQPAVQDTGPLVPSDLPEEPAPPSDATPEAVEPPPEPTVEPPLPQTPPPEEPLPPLEPEPEPPQIEPEPRPVMIPAPTHEPETTSVPVPAAVSPPELSDDAWGQPVPAPSGLPAFPSDVPRTEERRAPRDRVGPGPWLVAIAVTIALAVLAGVLITRGQAIFGPGSPDLPQADELRSRVLSAYTDMASLKANFEIRRLGLYRVDGEEETLRYSFSNGVLEGLIVYDRDVGHRERHTLRLGDQEIGRLQVVRRSADTESLLGAGGDAQLVVEANPPLGPPDGELRPHLGLLEDSVGTVMRLMATAADLEVVGAETHQGRDVFEVRFSASPDEHTRADEIEVWVDASTFLPVVVQRWITAANARVLGPEAALTNEHIQAAFGDLDRVVSERVELTSVSYGDLILPGDYVLDVPAGAEEQERDGQFGHVSAAGAVEQLGYAPLLPDSLPEGFRERALATFRGEEQQPWGPGGAYPAPEGVFAATYFDGMTTITVSQRRMSETFDLDGSPLATGGLIEIESMERGQRSFFYGSSPETPPHVFGFVGETFVVVSGFAPADLLGTFYASLNEPVAEEGEPFDIDGERETAE